MPPSWAYPYATVWDDFGPASNPVLLDTLQARSGGTWIQEAQQILLGTVDTPVYPWAFRGLTGYGRTPVAGGDPDTSENRFPTPCILVPQATDTNVYVRADVYMASNGIGGGTDAWIGLCSIAPFTSFTDAPFERGWVLSYSSEFELDADTFDNEYLLDGTNPPIEPLNVNTPSKYDRWLSLELRIDGGTVSAFVDKQLVGQANATWPMTQVYAMFHTFTGFATPTLGAYVANFEAGPVPRPVTVPQLAVSAGPSRVHFQPPRITT